MMMERMNGKVAYAVISFGASSLGMGEELLSSTLGKFEV